MAKISGSTTLTYVPLPQEVEAFELMSVTGSVRFDASGTPTRETLSVVAFRRVGAVRHPLDVNSDSAVTDHYVIFRAQVTEGGARSMMSFIGRSVQASKLRYADWAQFLLVDKEWVEFTDDGAPVFPDSEVLAVYDISVTHDGENGIPGAFPSTAFCRSASTPAKPSGGTYANPYPTTSGWHDAPPPDDGNPLWMSTARFLPGETDQKNWSAPVPAVNSVGVEIIWSPLDSPGKPADVHPFSDPLGKWSSAAADAVWMAVSLKNNGVWEPWQVSRVKGEGTPVIDVFPQAVTLRLGCPSDEKVYVDVYRGSEPLVPGSDFILSDLSDELELAPGLAWERVESFGSGEYRTFYSLIYDGSSEINLDFPFTVALDGNTYRRKISVRTSVDPVYAKVSPEVVQMKKGVVDYRAYIEVYDNGLVPSGQVGHPTLTDRAGGWITDNVRWNFATEDGRFCYIFTYLWPLGLDVNTDVSLEVTYRGKKYPVVIPLRSVNDGEDGADGKDGQDGKDGADGKDGHDGEDGADGKDGKDAVQYSLVASPTSVTFDLNAGKYDTAALKVKVLRTDGESVSEVASLPSGMTLQYELYQDGVLKRTVACPGKQLALATDIYSRIDWVLKQGSQEIARVTVGVSLSGKHGADGRNGVYVPPPMEWQDYPSGSPSDYYFMSGDLGKDPPESRLDIVVVRTSAGKLMPYRCVMSHWRSQATQPPDKDPERWAACDVGVYKFVATELLWANIGRIDFLSGQAFRIGDASGRICGYFGVPIKDSGAIIYSGGDTVSEASFIVYEDGRVVARNADIEGRVVAREADIEGRVSASVVDYRVSAAEGAVPDGSLCFDCSSVRLPELSEGRVRMLRILNPEMTRTPPETLRLIPDTGNVGVFPSLRFEHAATGTLTLQECGRNGAVYLELMGYYNPVSRLTLWGVVRNDAIS